MSRELKLYDASLTPPSFTAHMAPGEHALLHVDPRTDAVVNAEGRPFADPLHATCLVFASLDQARSYAEARVERAPAARCDIYDHRGKSREPVRIQSRAARRHAYRLVRWLTTLGAAMIVTGIALCAWDYANGWLQPLHSAVGTKLMMAGVLMFLSNVLRLGERPPA